MSHPGNDEIIDIKRDSQTNPLDPKRYALIDEMVHHATKMGIVPYKLLFIQVKLP